MALYIHDSHIFDIVCNYNGIELIKNKISSYGRKVQIEVRHKGTNDECILIQTRSDYRSFNYSNIVMLMPGYRSITINPIGDGNGENITKQIHDYIKDIPSILRDSKIRDIFND